MNYKSGELVKITGNSNGHNFNAGETVRLKRNCGGELHVWTAEYLDGHDFWYVCESDMTPAKPTAMPQKIIITTDGKTTLARLFDGKTMVKRAEAKCAPSDVFDFGVGAQLAFNRLVYGTDYHPSEVALKPEPKQEPVKLYCVKDFSCFGKRELIKGKVYEFDGHRVNYESAECFYAKDFEDWKRGDPSYSACLVPLVSRSAEVGEWVLVTDSRVDGFIGTVGKVERINSDGNPSVRHKRVWFDTHGDGTENTSMNGCKYRVLSGYTGDPA